MVNSQLQIYVTYSLGLHLRYPLTLTTASATTLYLCIALTRPCVLACSPFLHGSTACARSARAHCHGPQREHYLCAATRGMLNPQTVGSHVHSHAHVHHARTRTFMRADSESTRMSISTDERPRQGLVPTHESREAGKPLRCSTGILRRKGVAHAQTH